MSDVVIVAIIGGCVTVVSLLLKLLFEMVSLRKHVNSRMDELLNLHKTASRAEGNLEGRAEKKAEDKEENGK